MFLLPLAIHWVRVFLCPAKQKFVRMSPNPYLSFRVYDSKKIFGDREYCILLSYSYSLFPLLLSRSLIKVKNDYLQDNIDHIYFLITFQSTRSICFSMNKRV